MTLTRTALLGMRFWDRVTGRTVGDGLELRETRTRRLAGRTPGHVFAFHDLPGLRAASFGAGDDAFWAAPPASGRFTFELTDRDGRFVPFRFTMEAPHRGLFVPPCVAAAESPPAPERAVPLFSAPSRPAPPGLATVRADLWDAAADAPAAGAVLEVAAAGMAPCTGIADQQGRVVVLPSYPEPRWDGASPPPGASALARQQWTVTATARYAPGTEPDLCQMLMQPPATLLADESPVADLPPQTLTFGRELVLRSTGRPVLLVRPS
jgi:hypothetical protein